MTLDIASITARADKATAGPWPLRNTLEGDRGYATGPIYEIPKGGFKKSLAIGMQIMDDAAFIAHARTDIPDLLAALEASEAAVAKLEDERDELAEEVARFNEHRGSKQLLERALKAEAERDALKKALTAVRDDLQARAVKGVVAVGVSVWIEVNTALGSKP